jgi:hypothetical protein
MGRVLVGLSLVLWVVRCGSSGAPPGGKLDDGGTCPSTQIVVAPCCGGIVTDAGCTPPPRFCAPYPSSCGQTPTCACFATDPCSSEGGTCAGYDSQTYEIECVCG